MDADKTNTVTAKEFLAGLALAGVRPLPSEPELRTIFKLIDSDANRTLSLGELEELLGSPSEGATAMSETAGDSSDGEGGAEDVALPPMPENL